MPVRSVIIAGLLSVLSATAFGQWEILPALPGRDYTWSTKYAVNGLIITAVTSDSIAKSSDFGLTWKCLSPPESIAAINGYSEVDSLVFLSYVYFHDQSWRLLNGVWTRYWDYSPTNKVIRLEPYLFALTSDNFIYRSSDLGLSWLNTPMRSDGDADLIAFQGVLLESQGYGTIWRSIDTGSTWTYTAYLGGVPGKARFMVFQNVVVYGSQWGGLRISADSGKTWTKNGSFGGQINSMWCDSTGIFIGSEYGGVYSLDGGQSWRTLKDDLGQNSTCYAFFRCGKYVFVKSDRGLFRRTFDEAVTRVSESGERMPGTISLSQNYPNPFNPSTTIRYGLPNRSHVSLTVFNTLGQQVALLQNGEQEAGYHEVKFDGNGLSSGVYFYMVRAGDPSLRSGRVFVQTRRLMLLR